MSALVPDSDGVLRVGAPAKINLRLDVLARREDGYHEVDTTLLALDRADRLLVRATDEPGVRLRVRGADGGVPADATNLAARGAEAALALALARTERGLELELEKRVPSAAGLGGGSADAAAAFAAGLAVLGASVDAAAATAALARLGADCAFFHDARETGCARCTGIGERVAPLEGPRAPLFVCVLVPAVRCPTADVYAALDLARDPAPVPANEDVASASLETLRAQLENRLEPAALRAFPQLAAWRALLDASGAADFRLAGSGASFVGLSGDREEAEERRRALAAAGKARDLGLRASFVAAPAGAALLGPAGAGR